MDREVNRRETFEERQERKRQEFEARLEAQKAKRDWMMVILTFAAAAFAGWAAYEARDAGETARIALELDERPYIKIVPEDSQVITLGNTKKLEVTYRLAVLGKTPALKIDNSSTDCEISETPLMSDAPKIPKRKVNSPSASYLYPSEQSERYGCDTNMPSKEQDYFRFFGVINYEDVFQRKHSTPFCFESFINDNKMDDWQICRSNLPPLT